jgi:hypothetical protein
MGYAKDVYTVPASLAGTSCDLNLTSPRAHLYSNVTSCHVGLPAISVPVGFAANGMPFGLQLIGQVGPSLPPFHIPTTPSLTYATTQRLQDAKVLAVAQCVEDAMAFKPKQF